MELMEGLLKMNFESSESESIDYKLKTCEKCGQAIEAKHLLLGKERIVSVICSCRKKEIEEEGLNSSNREKQTRLNQIINNSLMDSKFKYDRFENWDHQKGNEKLFNITKRYANEFTQIKSKGVGLIIYGTPGNGKTYMSSCIANELIDRFIPVICVSINALLSRIKSTFNTYGQEGEMTILNSLNNADLLIIDDLGTEQQTDWSRATIYNIIDYRYRNGLPIIITTNISLEDIKTKYHQRTYDRLLEMCTPVKNDIGSIRISKSKEKTEFLNKILSGN